MYRKVISTGNLTASPPPIILYPVDFAPVTASALTMKKKRVSDSLLLFLINSSAFISIAILAGIMAYIFIHGIGQINWHFLTTVPSALKGSFGILGNMINTLYIIVITLLIAVPLGVGAAVYLNEYAKAGRAVRLIEFTTETLSGIPSIVFGLFGYVLFGTVLGLGYSILTGSLTLSIMVLPLITRTTQEALKTVPVSYRLGALGLGATKWHITCTLLLPGAMPGIITGVILAIGRIVGESAALLFTAGSGFLLSKHVLEKIFESGGTLTIQLYLSMQKARYDQAFGIAVILLFIVLLINGLAKWLSSHFITKGANS